MDDWNEGDDAQCILRGDWIEHGRCGPGFMTIHTVRRVKFRKWTPQRPFKIGLRFAEYPGMIYDSKAFRKIQPLEEDDELIESRELEDS